MELFKYISKNGNTCSVCTMYHPDKFETKWSLHVDGYPYGYYSREQDAKRVATILKRKLVRTGCTILHSENNSKWVN